jgi:hypothetical protein
MATDDELDELDVLVLRDDDGTFYGIPRQDLAHYRLEGEAEESVAAAAEKDVAGYGTLAIYQTSGTTVIGYFTPAPGTTPQPPAGHVYTRSGSPDRPWLIHTTLRRR